MRADIKNITCKITCCMLPNNIKDDVDGNLPNKTTSCCSFLKRFKFYRKANSSIDQEKEQDHSIKQS